MSSAWLTINRDYHRSRGKQGSLLGQPGDALVVLHTVLGICMCTHFARTISLLKSCSLSAFVAAVCAIALGNFMEYLLHFYLPNARCEI